jgi:hypothetical protein
MRAVIMWVLLVMFSFATASCDVEFLDLTRGEVVIQEANGQDVDGPYLSVNNSSKVLRIGDIDDSGNGGTTGNNNACLEAGETVGINIGISNTGKKDAYAVSIAVSTADPYVGEMKNTFKYIPFIEHDEYISSYSYGSSINGILVPVKDMAPHGHKIRIDVNLSDGNGGLWHDYCLLLVY